MRKSPIVRAGTFRIFNNVLLEWSFTDRILLAFLIFKEISLSYPRGAVEVLFLALINEVRSIASKIGNDLRNAFSSFDSCALKKHKHSRRILFSCAFEAITAAMIL
jgi:hypothetical protein